MCNHAELLKVAFKAVTIFHLSYTFFFSGDFRMSVIGLDNFA